ncbi:Rieske 2Fe-2S domain-containing protein [Stigmatella aurantiaca]|uniref:Iron-sulfur cluster-binding protein, Rieske family n=1 Tax=Stigmatella aurantiaca (strain DW4/3-1) TaxID=378806 RepID=Q096Q0_STIAD|nr:Rieske 2Fe-2S domain-containing protein [Stigmatella aurantiaca]ADO68573.1 Iron-sulfur cluster-binding protein, Rieske family [Stigmatella aurantiaca DW4/3-1]EAU67748.1 rieske [2Fe-2S] domain protein [Stigmatella aurantiaca DW4/3-1]
MTAKDHWHPVLDSQQLKDKPVGVKVWDSEIVLFRTANGTLSALEDRCPHRAMRLSKGWVENDKLVCPYHLWRYDSEGKGTSPCNPGMKPRVQRYDVAERYGAVWVKPVESNAQLPEFEVDGYHSVGLDTGIMYAPFELVVDNFIEIEHSPTNHGVFAFDAQAITQVVPKVETLGESIHVTYEGTQRHIPWWSPTQFFMPPKTRLVIDFMAHFRPVHFIYNMMWHDPKTNEQKPHKIREFAFLTPATAEETHIFLFFFSTVGIFSPKGLAPLRQIASKRFLKMAHHEFNLDKNIVEEVARTDKRTDLKGLQLGKFDRVLRETRRLIDSAYHQGPEQQVPAPVPLKATGTSGAVE